MLCLLTLLLLLLLEGCAWNTTLLVIHTRPGFPAKVVRVSTSSAGGKTGASAKADLDIQVPQYPCTARQSDSLLTITCQMPQ